MPCSSILRSFTSCPITKERRVSPGLRLRWGEVAVEVLWKHHPIVVLEGGVVDLEDVVEGVVLVRSKFLTRAVP